MKCKRKNTSKKAVKEIEMQEHENSLLYKLLLVCRKPCLKVPIPKLYQGIRNKMSTSCLAHKQQPSNKMLHKFGSIIYEPCRKERN